MIDKQPHKVVVTRVVTEHATIKAARAALKEVKLRRGELAVVISVNKKETGK
jgi:hypothetical protein